MRPGSTHHRSAAAPRHRTPQGTARTESLLAFLREYIAEHGHGPNLREMAAAIGSTSTSIAAYHLERLRADGRVAFKDGASRTVRVLE